MLQNSPGPRPTRQHRQPQQGIGQPHSGTQLALVLGEKHEQERRRGDEGTQAVAEVWLNDCHRGKQETATTNTDKKPLSQDNLPLFMAKREHHVAEHNAESTTQEQQLQMATVIDRTDHGAHGKDC